MTEQSRCASVQVDALQLQAELQAALADAAALRDELTQLKSARAMSSQADNAAPVSVAFPFLKPAATAEVEVYSSDQILVALDWPLEQFAHSACLRT